MPHPWRSESRHRSKSAGTALWTAPARWIVWLTICQCLPSAASAQSWRIEPSAKATVTATNNSGFANSTDSGGDVILDLLPRVALTGRGAHFSLNGFVEADSLTFVRNTQANQLIPSARLTLNANPVERWFYLDAGAGVTQSTVDPYSVVSSGGLPSERLQTRQYRLSPYLDHAFTPALNLYYRNDNVWTRRTGQVSATERRGDYELHSHAAIFALKPEPLGFSLEANQERTEYVVTTNTTLDLASARAVVTYAVDPTLSLSALVGTEESECAFAKTRDRIRGLRMRWLPSERTDLNVSVERRFFDNGWNVAWSHRSPFVAMNINLARQPSSQPSSFLLPTTGGDVRSLIDAAFTTRYPNPAERAVIVDNAVANLVNSNSTATAVEVFSDYAQLQTRATASVVFLSPRSALTLQVFTLKSEQLQRRDAPPPVGGLPNTADNRQTGIAIAFNRRLTTTLTVETALAVSQIKGLGAALGDSTDSASFRLAASQNLTPKTRAFLGGRLQHAKLVQFDTTTSIERSSTVQEIAGFLGIEHKF